MPMFGFTLKKGTEVITKGNFSSQQTAVMGFAKIKGLSVEDFQKIYKVIELNINGGK
jgi:hypothetical protein